MRLGPLRHLITLQVRSAGENAYGETLSWMDVASFHASVEPLSGRELLSAGQAQAEVSHRVRCRYRAGVTTAHRLVFKGLVLDIQAVINAHERGAMLEILCKEGPTDG